MSGALASAPVDLAAPPDRLRARAEMDAVWVGLPAAELPPVLVFLYVLLGAPFVAVPLLLVPLAPPFLLVSVAAIVALGLPWLYGALIQRIALRSPEIARAVHAACLVIAATALALSLLALEELALRALLLGAAAVYLGLGAQLARPAPELRLDLARLQVRWGKRRWTFSLEDLASAAVCDLDVPPLRGLWPAERAWIARLVAHYAAERQETLERQGHDLSAPAGPPPELLARQLLNRQDARGRQGLNETPACPARRDPGERGRI